MGLKREVKGAGKIVFTMKTVPWSELPFYKKIPLYLAKIRLLFKGVIARIKEEEVEFRPFTEESYKKLRKAKVLDDLR